MPKKVKKDSQLRVRLTPQQHNALLQRAMASDGRENISEVIRSMIEEDLENVDRKVSIKISKKCQQQIEKMADVLNRDPDQIVEACIMGVADMAFYESIDKPLIVQELELRKAYRDTTHAAVNGESSAP